MNVYKLAHPWICGLLLLDMAIGVQAQQPAGRAEATRLGAVGVSGGDDLAIARAAAKALH